MTFTTVANTTPYPWPFDGRIEADSLALLVCGAGPVWATRTPPDPTADAAIAALRDRCQAIGATVVSVVHAEPNNRPTALSHEPDRLAAPLADESTDVLVTAAGIDGFYGSNLDATLHRLGKTHLLVVGRGFETTVHSTLRRANDRGYECLTVADACSAIDPDCRAASVSSIEMSGGIFGAVGHTSAVLDALLALPPTT